jgi:hypothetical protein
MAFITKKLAILLHTITVVNTVKIISDKLRHVTGTFGGFDTLLLQAK